MPIWLHRLLRCLLGIAGFLATVSLAISQWDRTAPWLAPGAAAAAFWVMVMLVGLFALPAAFNRYCAARCPHCGGRCYAQEEPTGGWGVRNRPMLYRCLDCHASIDTGLRAR